MSECKYCDGFGHVEWLGAISLCSACKDTGQVDPRNKAEIALDEAWERNRGEQ